MDTDWLIALLIGLVALVVASSVARRAGDHADRQAGHRRAPQAHRRGPLGALVDVLDESVALFVLRERLGRSTATRAERRAEAVKAAAVAQADEIRRLRAAGAMPPRPPAHLIVTRTAATSTPFDGPDRQAHAAGAVRVATTGRSTLPLELVAAGLGVAVVIAIVLAIWPRDSVGVLSAPSSPPPSASPSPSVSADPVVAQSPGPTSTLPATATPVPTVAPTPTPRPATTAPTAAPTKRPTPRPTATPRPTPTATPVPTVAPTATPTPTAEPTSTVTPTPPATPGPIPMPDA